MPNKKTHFFLLSIICVLMFFCCCSKVENVDFKMNNHVYASTGIEPVMPVDSVKLLHVFVSDTTSIPDISEDEKKVKKRYWFADGEPIPNTDNLSFFPIYFISADMHNVTLIVNDEKPGVTKWINVQDDEYTWLDEPFIEEELNKRKTKKEPKLETRNSISNNENKSVQRFPIRFINLKNKQTVKRKRLKIEVEIIDVASKKNMLLNLNDKDHKFDFDAKTKKMTAKLKLEKGTNKIFVKARTSNGKIFRKGVTVERKRSIR